MLQKLKIIAFFAILLISQLALADINDLLNSRSRPTIADVESKMTEAELQQPITEQFSGVRQEQVPLIANLIAELEWAYPGAIYMPLGRDVVLIGDFVDAFYRSQGQPGRVIRLNASGQSLRIDDSMIARFVQSSGVDIKNLANGPSYIVFDVSGYGLPRGSQSTKILHAVYNEYVRLGGKAKDLVRKFAFVNLTASHGGGLAINPGVDREAFFLEHVKHLEVNPMSIPQRSFTGSQHLRGQSEWHTNFGLLTEMPDKSVIAPVPAEPNALEVRKKILQEQRLTLLTVRQPWFIEQVQKRAKELGYEFKLKKQSCDQALSAGPY